MRKVASSYAMEAGEPLPKAAMVGVDVLDMDRTAHPLAGAQLDRLVRDAGFARKVAVGSVRVAHQQYVFVRYWRQVLMKLTLGHRTESGDESEGLSGPIAGDQDTNLLIGDPSLGGGSAVFSGRSKQLARSLVGQEPVAPPETGVAVHADRSCSSLNCRRVQYAAEVIEPLFSVSQASRRAASQ